MKRSKSYRQAAEGFDKDTVYSPLAAAKTSAP